MKKHAKKIIAPVIIAFYIVLNCLVVAGALILAGDVHVPIVAIFIIIPFALAGVGIFVLVERIKEIRDGEEDDLGKY